MHIAIKYILLTEVETEDYTLTEFELKTFSCLELQKVYTFCSICYSEAGGNNSLYF